MKKSLVLAMAMALGVTASAYAANPFSDVPAGHWAYDSVAELAAAGVVDGYGDGTFGGDKLMTRYEMAQIVAKAMANGANVDKLAAEFADELDNLGVRVANLEKKADNVKVTGEMRYRYADSENGCNTNDLRSRLWVTGQVNDDWSYTGMIENVQDFDNDAAEDSDVRFQRAYVNGKLGGLDVTAGRYNMFVADGNIYDTRVDGVEVSYGDKVKVTGYVGKGADESDVYDDNGVEYDYNYAGLYVGGDIKAELAEGLNLNAGYMNFKDMYEVGSAKSNIDNAIWFAGADWTVGDVTLSGMYLKGDASAEHPTAVGKLNKTDDDGFVVGLAYKGAKADEVGSWGLNAHYYDQGGQTYVAHTTDANVFGFKAVGKDAREYNEGFKGYGVAADYTFAKNIIGTVAYYDTESKQHSDKDDQILWADVTFTF